MSNCCICRAGMSGIKGAYINIGEVVCLDHDGKLVPMLPSRKGPTEGLAPRNIPESELFWPVTTLPFAPAPRDDSMIYLSETKETD